MTPEQVLAGHTRFVSPPRGKKVGSLNLLGVDDMLVVPPRTYLVKGLLAAREMALLYGEPGCGKSFMALHLAYALAQGRKFFSRRVAATPVIYCGLEGETGVAKRVQALAREHGSAKGFHCIVQPLPLADNAALADDMVTCVTTVGAGLVVIDTLARAMAGADETAEGFGAMVKIFDRVRSETNAAILIVHHAGKDKARGARGSNALLAAADLAIEVEVSAESGRTWRVVKAKDDPGGDAFAFSLRSVALGADEDGDAITTCLVEEGDATGAAARRKLSPQQAAALANLHETVLASGSDLPSGHGFPPAPARGCRLDAWREECRRRGLANSDDPATQGRVFRRALADLKKANRIAEYDGWVWTVREPK